MTAARVIDHSMRVADHPEPVSASDTGNSYTATSLHSVQGFAPADTPTGDEHPLPPGQPKRDFRWIYADLAQNGSPGPRMESRGHASGHDFATDRGTFANTDEVLPFLTTDR